MDHVSRKAPTFGWGHISGSWVVPLGLYYLEGMHGRFRAISGVTLRDLSWEYDLRGRAQDPTSKFKLKRLLRRKRNSNSWKHDAIFHKPVSCCIVSHFMVRCWQSSEPSVCRSRPRLRAAFDCHLLPAHHGHLASGFPSDGRRAPAQTQATVLCKACRFIKFQYGN